MIDAFGPGEMSIPSGPFQGTRGRRARGMCMLMDGAPVRSVALACDVHHRTVGNWRGTLRERGLLPSSPSAESTAR